MFISLKSMNQMTSIQNLNEDIYINKHLAYF